MIWCLDLILCCTTVAELSSCNRYCVVHKHTNKKHTPWPFNKISLLLQITVLRRILKLYLVFMIDFHYLPWVREGGNCYLYMPEIKMSPRLGWLFPLLNIVFLLSVRSLGLHFQKLALLGSLSNNNAQWSDSCKLHKTIF